MNEQTRDTPTNIPHSTHHQHVLSPQQHAILMSPSSVDSQLMNYCVHEEELLPHNCLGQQTKLDQLVAKKTANTKRTWKAGVPFILFLIVCCLVFIFCRDHLEDFLNWLDALPRWQSGIIFVVLFTIISLPGSFGYLILNIAAGYMYGFWLGMLIIFISVTIGSVVAFVLIRKCLPGCIERLLSDGDDAALINPMLRIIEGKNGVKVIALFRLTPLPFGFQNGVFALTDISIFKYTLATCIGLLPTQALNTYFGTTLRSIKDVVSNDGESYILFSFQLLISLVLMIFVARLARQEINKCSDTTDKGDLESGEGFKKGHSRSKSASAILMSKQKIINQPSIFK